MYLRMVHTQFQGQVTQTQDLSIVRNGGLSHSVRIAHVGVSNIGHIFIAGHGIGQLYHGATHGILHAPQRLIHGLGIPRVVLFD